MSAQPHQCALTWRARSPQGLQQSTAVIWSILTYMQEIYLSMVSWLLRHVCVIWAPMGWEIVSQEVCPLGLGVDSEGVLFGCALHPDVVLTAPS